MMNNISQLFFKYEKELERFLLNRNVYFKNNDTHQAEHEKGWHQLFDTNRQSHLDFLQQKLKSD